MKIKVKKMLLGLFLICASSVTASAQNEKDDWPEILSYTDIGKKILPFSRDPLDVNSCYEIIRLLKYSGDPFNSSEGGTIEQYIPALGLIINRYDEKVTPMLVAYALKVESVYLKRRAIYCIEKLEKTSLRVYLENLYETKELLRKFDVLVQEAEIKAKGRSYYFTMFSKEEEEKNGYFKELREKGGAVPTLKAVESEKE